MERKYSLPEQKISELSDQNHTLANMNRLGLVDSDLFISKSNELAQQIQAAKQERDRLTHEDKDDTIEGTREILEILDSAPEFQNEIFEFLIDHIAVQREDRLKFHLINDLELTEAIERAVR